MKLTHQIKAIIFLIMSIPFSIPSAAQSAAPSMPVTVSVSITANKTVIVAYNDKVRNWLITDNESHWSENEIDALQNALHYTFEALAAYDFDGETLLSGYCFRHETRPFVGGVEGQMGTIDHNSKVIRLSDMAFTVLNGFAIYHELGHAVDNRLNLQLSKGFNHYSGGPELPEIGQQWHTADNYWLREQGRYTLSEASADGFAVFVMIQYANLPRPIFAHEPVTTDYAGISAATSQALQTNDLH